MTTPDWIIVGRLRKPHGIGGDVVVESITDAPEKVFAAGRRVFAGTVEGDPAPDHAELTVTRSRPFKIGLWIIEFDAIGDRGQAERWRDRYLLLPAAEIDPPGVGEVFVHELLGMLVELTSGETVGPVSEVYELPQALGLNVRYRDGNVILPYHDAYVREVDRAARRIVMELPDGMLE